MKKTRKLTMNIGIISFLIMFIILCMVTFSVLSLVSAKSNKEVANRSIQHKEDYTTLCNEGEKKLKQLDDILYMVYKSSTSKEDYFNQLLNIEKINDSMKIEDHRITFSIFYKAQKLYVEIEVLYPGNKLYRLNVWKVESAKEWEPDHKLNIL